MLVLECIKRMNKRAFNGVMLSDEENQVRGLLYSLVTALNKRGPKVGAERLSEEASRVLGAMRQSELAGIKLQETDRNVQSA
jgi:hypothetical protein